RSANRTVETGRSPSEEISAQPAKTSTHAPITSIAGTVPRPYIGQTRSKNSLELVLSGGKGKTAVRGDTVLAFAVRTRGEVVMCCARLVFVRLLNQFVSSHS